MGIVFEMPCSRGLRKAKNASRVILRALVVTMMLSLALGIAGVWSGNVNALVLVAMVLSFASLCGWHARKEYRRLNYVDGIGPEVPPP